MAFLETPRLDTKITRGAKSTVQTSRKKAYTISGKLSQQFNWSRLKHEMDLSHGVRDRADYQALLDFFYVVMGGAYIGFRVKDWRDFIATQLNTSLTVISGNTWQLQRKHTAGAVSYLRDIYKPCTTPAVIVYNAGGGVLSASIDYTTGIATVTGTPATWAGEFDIPMTFVDDEWTGDLEVNINNLHVESHPILLEEIRLT